MAEEDLKLVAKIEADFSQIPSQITSVERIFKSAQPRLQQAAQINFAQGFQFRGPNNQISFGGAANMSSGNALSVDAFKDFHRSIDKNTNALDTLTKLSMKMGGVIGAFAVAADAANSFDTMMTGGPNSGSQALKGFWRSMGPTGAAGSAIGDAISNALGFGTSEGNMAAALKTNFEAKANELTSGKTGTALARGLFRMQEVQLAQEAYSPEWKNPEAYMAHVKERTKQIAADEILFERQRSSGLRRMSGLTDATMMSALGLSLPGQLAAIKSKTEEDAYAAMLGGDKQQADAIRKMGRAQALSAILSSGGPGQEVSGTAMSLGGIRANGMGLGGDEIAGLLKQIVDNTADPTAGAARN